jgi:hypothetical protein
MPERHHAGHDDDDMTPNDGAWTHDMAVHRKAAEVRAERDRDRAEQVRRAESPLVRLRRVFGGSGAQT